MIYHVHLYIVRSNYRRRFVGQTATPNQSKVCSQSERFYQMLDLSVKPTIKQLLN